MSAVIADTQSAIWYILNSPRLSPAAVRALDGASQGGDAIFVASISIVETTYLVEKGRVPQADASKLITQLSDPNFELTLIPLNFEIAQAVGQIPRNIVPDMPDRIIAATALQMGLPLVSSDHQIQAASNIQTIW